MGKGSEKRVGAVGLGILRWSLVFIFVAFGLYKFTPQEAAGIAPLTTHSPFLFWLNPLLGLRGGSNVIGVIEILLGERMALRHVRPLVSAYGSLLTAAVLVVTLSFLFTTPGLDPTRRRGILAQGHRASWRSAAHCGRGICCRARRRAENWLVLIENPAHAIGRVYVAAGEKRRLGSDYRHVPDAQH